VSDIYTYSVHALIITQTSPRLATPNSRQTTYKVHTLNTVAHLAHMEGACVTGHANTCSKNIADRVKEKPTQVSEKQRTRKSGAKRINL